MTYPEALFEKVILSKSISDQIIRIKQAETIDVTGILGKFTDLGFSRTDFVYGTTQLAVRGGILDIYSFGNEKPYRIELFGNEVDSIRIFDPETQLSEKRLLQVNLIPNLSYRETEAGFGAGAEEKISLPEFMPGKSVVWINQRAFIKERIEQQSEDLSVYLDLLKSGQIRSGEEEEETQEQANVTEKDFIDARMLDSLLEKYPVIEMGGGKTAVGMQEIRFNSLEQPAFNRQFDLLIKNLQEHERKQYNVLVFSDNPKQLERLHSIFTDLKAEIQVTPIAVSIHEGFIDHDLKLICYTDHQIFQRYHKYRVKQAFQEQGADTENTYQECNPAITCRISIMAWAFTAACKK